MTNLTSRYLSTASLLIPADQRAEFRDELTERITDTFDAKVASGAAYDDAERETIAELGDPIALTTQYTGKPMHLIGPRYYPQWRLVAHIVVPLSAGLAWLGTLISLLVAQPRPPWWQIAGQTMGNMLSMAAFAFAIITIIFAILERVPEKTAATADEALRELDWTPDRLGETTEKNSGRAGSIVELCFLAALAGVVTFADRLPIFWRDGQAVEMPLFNPDTWRWLRWALLAVIAIEVAIVVWRMVRPRVTWGVVAATAVSSVAFAAVVLPPLLTGTLINPDVFEFFGDTGAAAQAAAPGGWATLLSAFLVICGAIAEPIVVAVEKWKQ